MFLYYSHVKQWEYNGNILFLYYPVIPLFLYYSHEIIWYGDIMGISWEYHGTTIDDDLGEGHILVISYSPERSISIHSSLCTFSVIKVAIDGHYLGSHHFQRAFSYDSTVYTLAILNNSFGEFFIMPMPTIFHKRVGGPLRSKQMQLTSGFPRVCTPIWPHIEQTNALLLLLMYVN